MANVNDTEFNPDLLEHLAQSLAFEKMAEPLQDTMFAKIKQRIEDKPPAGTITIKADAGEWLPLTDKIEIKLLHTDQQDGMTTSLWRLQPGAFLPSHPHAADEECLVLEGEFLIGDHRLRAGDFHIAKKGCTHPDSYSPTGGLLMIRTLSEHLPSAPV